MEEKTIRDFFAWRIRRLNKEQDETCERLEFGTGLNVSRIMSGAHSLTDRTKCKIYNYYNITLDEFHKPYPEFLSEYYSEEIK